MAFIYAWFHFGHVRDTDLDLSQTVGHNCWRDFNFSGIDHNIFGSYIAANVQCSRK